MLQHIRDKTQGWFTTAIISVICITFVFWGVHSFVGGSSSTPDMVAKVDGTVITKNQVEATYNRLREQQQIQLGASFVLTDAVSQKLHQTALEQLVSSQALAENALSDDLRFTPTQVGAVIAGISAFQDKGHFSPSRFVQAIASLGFSEQGFYNDVRDAMLINQMRVGLVASNFALPEEINTSLHLINQKRDVRYLLLPVKDFLAKVNVSDVAIKSYYQQHQDQYKSPEGVTLQYLSLTLNDLIAKQSVSDKEARAFYEANLANYTQPAKWQLQTVFLSQASNSDSAKIMKAVVAAFNTAKNVTEIQAIDANLQIQTSYWLSDQELDPAIQAVVSHLTEGQVSAPIKTPQGFVVVKLMAKQKAKVQAFDQVKTQVVAALAQQKATQAFSDSSEQLSQLTYTTADSLATAAKALGLPIKTTGPLTQDSAQTDLWASAVVRTAAFSSDVLAGNNSSLLNVSDSQVMVIRLVKHTIAAVLPEVSVSKTIKVILQQQQAVQMAKTFADQLVALIRTGKDTQAWFKAHHWQWTTAKAVGRYSAKLNGSIVNAAFQLARPSKLPSINVFHVGKNDFAVVQLLSITEAQDAALTPIQQRVMAEQIASGYAQLDYQLYVNGVMKKAKIAFAQAAPAP